MQCPFSQDSLAFPSAARSSFSQDAHTHIISTARSSFSQDSLFYPSPKIFLTRNAWHTLSGLCIHSFHLKIHILTRPLRSVSATAFSQCQNCHKNTHEGNNFLTRTSGYHAFTNSLPFFFFFFLFFSFCHIHHSLRKNKQTSKTFPHQAMSQLHHPETFHTNCRLLVREDLFCFCIASVVHCFLLFCLCFLPPPAVASRNALLGAPATDSEGENGKDWNSIARKWKRTLQVWPLTRGVGQTAANPTKDAANCCGNGDFSLGFVARCLSAWWHRLSSPCITECMWKNCI